MKILFFDTETTGLSPQTDEVTEVGAVTYDSDARTAVRISGYLVKTKVPISAEITKLTGITQAAIDEYGIPSKPALEGLLRQARGVDWFCAHNAEFDKGMLEGWCKREGVEMPKTPFIDTRTDLPVRAYERGKSASLKYLACDHNFLYPAHRAVNDCLAALTIFEMYPLEEIIERAKTPNVKVRAVISFENRAQAKERGFFWDPEKKWWWKPMKLNMVPIEKENAPFPVVLMTENKEGE